MTIASWAVITLIVGAMAGLVVLGPRWRTPERGEPESKTDEDRESQP